MAGHNLYWALQDLLKQYGLVRVSRKSGRKEVEVWVHPNEALRLEIIGSGASDAEVRKAERSRR